MDAEGDDLGTIRRREAKSGLVSYSDPVVLHETSKRRVVFVPFYIPRSHGNDLGMKITTYLKRQAPTDWVPLEEKSVSLDQAAARTLLKALRQHFGVAKEAKDGEYIFIRVSEKTAQLGEHDPAAIAAALTSVLSQREIVAHLANLELSDELARAFRGAIRLKEMRAAVTELRVTLDRGENEEQVYQRWCEKHTWAFGNAYVVRDNVRDISTGDSLDLLLPTVIAGYRDIVELKRPDAGVILYDEAHRDHYFSADVSKAIGQCHRYLDVLHEVAAHGLRDHPEIVAYHPRGIIVIGRSAKWDGDQLKALHGLNHRLSGITVMTYDQLLAQGERLVEMLSASDRDVDREADADNEDWPESDGPGSEEPIPFVIV